MSFLGSSTKDDLGRAALLGRGAIETGGLHDRQDGRCWRPTLSVQLFDVLANVSADVSLAGQHLV